MGIKWKCKGCGKWFEFPDTPNYETSRIEQLVHFIYTCFVNDGRMCSSCEAEAKSKSNKNNRRVK